MSFSQYVTIGQFVPTQSFLHKLDPRTKLIFILSYIGIIFFIQDFIGYFLLFAFTVIGMLVSKIPVSYYWRGMIPILWMILFTILIHLTMTKGGDVYFQWKWLTIYEQGVKQAMLISFRLLLLVFVATMLTLTTSPIDLTMGLQKLMRPLLLFRIPVHELALMMSISLRFIPTLLDETEKIMKAQKARGANFDTGPFYQRVKNMVSIIIPLFISAFKRAEELAIAMEARGYQGEKGRTRLRTIRFSWRDFLFFAVFISYFILVWMVRN